MSYIPKVFAIQHGARHRYAVPRMLHSLDYLTGLFTDSHAGSPLGKLAGTARRLLPRFAPIARLADREIKGVPLDLVSATDRWVFQQRSLRRLAAEDTTAWLKARDKSWYALARSAIAKGTNILYSMGGENLRLLQQAKNSGIRVVSDAFITPLNLRQTRDAKMAHGIPVSKDEEDCQHVEEHYNRVFGCSDIILCPSQWVADGVVALSPGHLSKIRICQYGSSLPPSPAIRKPVAGRIFWAGGDWFRKGLHHLAAAADLAKACNPAIEFRIAGITDPQVLAMPVFRNLRFLGKLDRQGMQREFASADLFVFPTLSEGMASVLIEAIASGCPVITTSGAGFDGLEESGAGRVLKVGETQALATAIVNLVGDRPTLHGMSEASARFAPRFTEAAWADRLGYILREVAL
ncbi:MAG: glycosyltransferase family 4 protein [Verrucomicrobiota bacterium]